MRDARKMEAGNVSQHQPMKFLAGLCLFAWASVCHGAPESDALAAGFAEPPAEARPLVFWQWVNGNVTHEGIRLDLEWMQRIGLAGALWFDAGFRTPPVPQFVEKRIGFGTPEWAQAIRFAASEARRLGLELGAQSSGGWSVSGGPMVPPEQAMKKLVWSETIVTPTTPLSSTLPAPPSNSGPYQDLPIDESFREPARSASVAVIAYRLPQIEQTELPRPVLGGVANASLLDDQCYSATTDLVPDAQGNASLSVTFAPGAVPRALTISARGPLPRAHVEASNEGLHFRSVAELPGPSAQAAPASTYVLPESSGTHWRIRFTGMTRPLSLAEVRFEFGARIDRAQEKAGYGVLADNVPSNVAMPANLVIDPHNVIDLSEKLAADGTLSWRPREGRWAVVRFGWSLTGRRTVPATAESIGLEVDKLDARAVRAFADAFYDRFAKAMGDAGALRIALTDSWEAGQQNWTPAMFEEFSARRGYALHAWLPVLTGRVVGDVARSERFLADYRRTIADLVADHHYGVLTQVAHERGMTTYAEAAGTDLPTIVDGIQAKSRVDVPMGEYWFYPEDGVPKPNHVADVREAASAAHLHGRNIVAAEALTTLGEAPWATGPAQLRRIVDRFFAEGINRVVLHTSAHQPFTDRKPGITLRQYGQHFTRNETWAEDAGAWVQYLARTSWLLQQGRPVADVAVFLGDDAALSPPFDRPGYPRRFAGFDHDFVNGESLGRLRVKERRLERPDGGGYRALVIAPHVRRMSLSTMTKLREWIADGGVLIGSKPLGAVGLKHDAEVLALADEIWNGRANVHVDQGLEDVMRKEKLPPDFDVVGMGRLHWTHRATRDTDIYFVSNQGTAAFDGTVQFRVRGRRVEAWDATDGSTSPMSYSIGDQTTGVRLQLAPFTSRFIVFSGRSPGPEFVAPRKTRSVLSTLDGPWTVEFLDGQGAPARLPLQALISWPESTDPAIRYYSGRAKYTQTFSLPKAWRAAGQRVELDLGVVGELARVRINGQDLGVLWSAPLRRDVTHALRAGENQVEIIVTNYWANRLIGDEQPGATRVTFAPVRPYTASSPLRRSGLLGPVRLYAVTVSDKNGSQAKALH